MAHTKKIQFYRNQTVVRPDTTNNKTAYTVAKETFNNIDTAEDGEICLVRYKEGDNDPIKTLTGVYHLNGNNGVWTLIQDELVSGDNIRTFGNEDLLGNGNVSPFIPYAQVDSTSTSTAFTATVPGITELKDGVCCLLKNGVVTSASGGFTINVNGLGAKPSYTNLAAATQDTTTFNVNYTMLFVYDSTRVAGGCWILYRGYDSNTNTIGYQLRTNNTAMTVTDTARYYKIYFTSVDDTQWVPASVNSTNNATSSRTVNQRPIDPFGRIVYTSASTNYTAGSNLAATTIWDQYNLTLGYSFNRTGAALTLTTKAPVYIKCAPQSDGSAIIDSTTPYVQDLPTTNDGKIYIFLGIATSATQVELVINHPVYYHDGTGIRIWTGHTFATVSTSGSYNDLSDKPQIPSISGLATETYVDTAVSNLVNSAPATLDTLNELAAALGNDANFATTATNQLANKADKIVTGTLTAQYTNDELTGYTCNKTFTELTTAFSASGIVLLHETDRYNCYLYPYEKTVNLLTFYGINNTDTESLKVTISNSNVITYTDSPVVWDCGDY